MPSFGYQRMWLMVSLQSGALWAASCPDTPTSWTGLAMEYTTVHQYNGAMLQVRGVPKNGRLQGKRVLKIRGDHYWMHSAHYDVVFSPLGPPAAGAPMANFSVQRVQSVSVSTPEFVLNYDPADQRGQLTRKDPALRRLEDASKHVIVLNEFIQASRRGARTQHDVVRTGQTRYIAGHCCEVYASKQLDMQQCLALLGERYVGLWDRRGLNDPRQSFEATATAVRFNPAIDAQTFAVPPGYHIETREPKRRR